MRGSESRNITLFLVLWSTIVVVLFLHTSGKLTLPWLNFPVASGNLLLVEIYKGYNVIGVKDEIYAVPHGHPFIHPRRKKKMKEIGMFAARSLEEAKRMINKKTENIEPRLVLLEKSCGGYDLYELGNQIYAVPAIGDWVGPGVMARPYSEYFAGSNLDEAKRFAKAHPVAGK